MNNNDMNNNEVKTTLGCSIEYPKVGDKLYLRQKTGDYYVDICKTPYTVVRVTETTVQVRECELLFSGPRYYDSLPEEIIEGNSSSRTKILRWSKKNNRWECKDYRGDPYPEFAVFGEWKYQPYLD